MVNITGSLQKIKNLFKTDVGIGLMILLLQLFLFVNIQSIYGAAAAAVKNTFILYFFLLLFPLAGFNVPLPSLRASFGRLGNFAAWFLVTGAATTMLITITGRFGGIIGSFEQVTLALGFGLLHSFVKAFNEEVVFRALLPKAGLSDFLSALAFGFFHFGVVTASQGFGTGILAMIWLTFLGLGWTWVYKRFGLYAAVGSHFGYNLAILGLAPQIIGIAVV